MQLKIPLSQIKTINIACQPTQPNPLLTNTKQYQTIFYLVKNVLTVLAYQ
jgi:hypothetical protein